LGPHAKTVYDAAITLDAIAGHTPDDPKTAVAIDKTPHGGYTSRLSSTALEGKRIGLFGRGWRNVNLTSETQALYDQATAVLTAEGATLVTDPFAGSNFSALAKPIWSGFDLRGFESIVYDFEQYLEQLRPTAAENSLQELKTALGVDLFGPGGPLSFVPQNFAVARESLDNPDLPPDLSEFMAVRAQYLDVFTRVMEANDLDALAFPQMFRPTPSLSGSASIGALTVSEINILGTPGVTVPAGYYASGSPFSLIFLGESFSEAELLGYAFDYEHSTMHRVAPNLILPGDYNEDGTVDAADYVVWRNGLGGIYKQSDYDVWRAHFGHTAGSGGADPLSRRSTSPDPLSAEVPEPAPFTLLIIATVAHYTPRRSRSSSAAWRRVC
jgi:Asp-tRNA(Asn)/Glu-tRNA(Gln) amidotransferase A subunit family amidase